MHILIINRLSKVIVAFLVIFFGTTGVNAKCTYQEQADLNVDARNVKTSYEIEEKRIMTQVTNPDTGEVIDYERIISEFKVSIYNITPDIYLTQHNDKTNETVNIFNEMAADGVYTFITDDIDNIVTYTYKVHSNLEGCRGDSLRTYTIKKPKANMFAQMGICQGLEDIPYCKPYITENINISESQIAQAIADYLVDHPTIVSEDKKDDDVLGFLKNNVGYIILGIVLIGGTAGGAIYIVRKRSAL